ncbi:2-polyprenyl-6-methoxyphenol hydroxylase-like FAD-dependent oxidoreductase [Kribbella sp. VKM Ac-2569]|uniref:FAD-dependent monooxygenase n=1 Tax=Kribbella sp. VKM Ac-2569 TaxID=2512220 RepID=UPI00102B5445|nr:FAD-dependent monooxygenase [Kribbella sp. VKM Ac-2569]RZT20771.1 2-polyprenyl-6-methoxyphenol hydroxylase-like FAD-dependent oxidoreductase [Kribbella sp. VKM Ac-2569]
MTTVLISGASIAGPALAYWLDRYGFEVTVVEKSGVIRGGGYPIDIRGTARDVVDRMGLLPRLQKAHVGTRRISFVDPDGTPIAAIQPESLTGGAEGLDLEVRRGDLADALYAPIKDRVEFLFDDSIATLDDRGDRVDVVFASGTARTFDLVIGADGLHSNTRRLVFGPEEQFHRYIGYAFAGFTLPNDFGLSREGVVWNVPGRAAVFYAQEPDQDVHGFLTFRQEEPPYDAFRNPQAQRELVAAKFPEQSWHVPRLVQAMGEADDMFFDVVSQIHMPTWSRGRVALAGDAAHATSFLSGQGSSVALVGAYVLAGELATYADHATAFTAYEQRIRGFVEQNQALVENGRSSLAPETQELIDARNAALRSGAAASAQRHEAHTALDLPEYGSAAQR